MKLLKKIAALLLIVHAAHAADDAAQERALIEEAGRLAESSGQLAIEGVRPSQVFSEIVACLTALRARHADLKSRVETEGTYVQSLEVQAALARQQNAAAAAILGYALPSLPSSSMSISTSAGSNDGQNHQEARPNKRIERTESVDYTEEAAKRQRALGDSHKVYCEVCETSYAQISKHRKSQMHQARDQGLPFPNRSSKAREGGPFCDVCQVPCSNITMHRKTRLHQAKLTSQSAGLILSVESIDQCPTSPDVGGLAESSIAHLVIENE